MTEKEIILECQAGNPIHQKELVVRYSPMLMSVSRRYSRDEGFAQDVLQDSFIKIFRAIPRYKMTGSFEAWMRRIVINTALQTLDRNCFKREKAGLDFKHDTPVAPSVYGSMEADKIMEKVMELPNGYRQVFNLFAIEGYSHREIGEMLNITESTSRSQLTRARKLLQKVVTAMKKISA